MRSAVDVGRPKISGPGLSSTYHHILVCHSCLHLPWLIVDGCHTTSMSSVPYWLICIPLYAVTVVDIWCRPDGILSDLTLGGV